MNDNNFWLSPSIDELVETQGVVPISDIRELFGTWSGDPDDGFEDMINTFRRQNLFGGTVNDGYRK